MELRNILVALLLTLSQSGFCAKLVLRVPNEVSSAVGQFRLDYWPNQGRPPPNVTLDPHQLRTPFAVEDVAPGTKYDFRLFFRNASIAGEWQTWTASITTAPDPPTNIVIRPRKTPQVLWDPPATGSVSEYKIKVIPLSEPLTSIRTLVVSQDASPFPLRDLTPGASYKLEIYSLLDKKESLVPATANFTLRPNTPGRFIVWFRNETTLLVLWQPPYPVGIYSNYKVSIDPPDAVESTLDVDKVGEPPGPAQAPFNGLVPGRAYNISVQTVSGGEISFPTTAQYRTVPLRPHSVSFDRRFLASDAFQVMWEEPKGESEFDRYHISISGGKQAPKTVQRGDPRMAVFNTDLEPGKTYQVLVKTMSGNVASWPATGNVTTRPLAVQNLNASLKAAVPLPDSDVGSGSAIWLTWSPDANSVQDAYRVSYQELDNFNSDSSTTTILTPSAILDSLLPGRNYSIQVQALSNGVEGPLVTIFQATRPSPPIIEDLTPLANALNLSWKSDVTSRQDRYAVTYIRNDTGETITKDVTEPRILLTGLFPGAGYNLKVFAISHNLWSEPHQYFQATVPFNPRNLEITSLKNASVVLNWRPPLDSLYTHFVIRYRVVDSTNWTEVPLVERSKSKIVDQDTPITTTVHGLVPGQRYVFHVNTVSHRVESAQALQQEHTIPPSPELPLQSAVGSSNVSLSWQSPKGRVGHYKLVWYEIPTSDDSETTTIASDVTEMLAKNLKEKEIEGTATSAFIEDLFPGAAYAFELSAFSYGVESNKTSIVIRTMPLIASDLVLAKRHESNTLTLRYTPTPLSISKFSLYMFRLSDGKSFSVVQQKLVSDQDRKLIFTDLVPGRMYELTAWTESAGVPSLPIRRQDRLHPEPVSQINATDISDTEIHLTWNLPAGDYDAFEVEYFDTTTNQLVKAQTTRHDMPLVDLRPHRNYTFTITVLAGMNTSELRTSSSHSASFVTLESVPGKVSIFKPAGVTPSQINFDWALPAQDQNGVLIGYTVTYGILGSTYTVSQDFPPGSTTGQVSGLTPGKTYLFRIQAKTKVGSGSFAKWEQTMPVWAPPKPDKKSLPLEIQKTTTTIRVRYKKNFFSDENGQITDYAIIVAEDDSKDSSMLDMLRWRDVQSYNMWPPYQATEPFYPFTNASAVSDDFVIGSDSCDGKTGYCNGPLKPGTTYKIKVRAYTARDKFTDTAYSLPITTEPDNTGLVVGIIVPLFLAALVGLAIVIIRRRRRRVVRGKGPHRPEGLSHLDRIISANRPVKLKDFGEHFRIMAADSDFRFSEEYEELKNVGREATCMAADLPVNRPKNRFTNILPYDHSRVKLNPTDDEEGSDYINANYVPGFNSPREFIVTQGPLHSTRDDFWRMCWESGTRNIIMLTRCVEKGREKCDRYWPYDTQPIFYGDIQVTILNESHYADWSISEFRVSRGESSRILRHFHFTTWPDFGVPDPPTTLVRFVRTFRERVGIDHKPIVVHCSAGVGRSGTFIALDRILLGMSKYDFVDIFGIVYEMRKERVWMVQTEQQYICIHQCVLAVLEGREMDLQGSSVEVHENQGFEDDEGIAESGM